MNCRKILPFIAILFSCFAMPLSSLADYICIRPGDLDSNFGEKGMITTDFFGHGDFASNVAIQPDGRIIVVGSIETDNDLDAVDFALARYKQDGSLDKSFGNGGKISTDFFGERDTASAVAIQPNGKILVVGSTRHRNSPNFALVRYKENGSLDESFGDGGKVTTDFFGEFDEANDIALQPNGKIVVAGVARGEDTGAVDYALARYNEDGSLDESFGDGGKVITNYMGCHTYGADLVLQPDGKMIVTGVACNDFALARFNEDGSLDESFGDGGWVTTDFFRDADYASSIALERDGKIIVSGSAYITNVGQDFALARYNEDGSIDSSFGDEGKVMTDFFGNSNSANGVAIHNDGNIVAVGNTGDDFAIARYLHNGQLRLTIQAEDYDQGGQNAAYFDKTPGNKSGQYRSDDVDIWKYGTSIYYTGSNATDEWMNYTIDVPYDGNYSF